MDHIDRNLDRELTLEELSNVANFSRFHFHRIFRGMVGESLNQFIQRIRIEKAASQLVELPDKPITNIAMDFGYSSSATFARAFKTRFDMSASAWRNMMMNSKNGKTVRKEHQLLGKQWKGSSDPYVYSRREWLMEMDPTTRTLKWSKSNMTTMNDVTVEAFTTGKLGVVTAPVAVVARTHEEEIASEDDDFRFVDERVNSPCR